MLKLSLDDLQFNINKLLYSTYNVFIYYNMNPLGALKDSMTKMLKDEAKMKEKPDYKAEYEKDQPNL